jgi:hypothetical protein
MNETEFKAMFELVKQTDAERFQILCETMSQIAMDVFCDGDRKDAAWKRASDSLGEATVHVVNRLGN